MKEVIQDCTCCWQRPADPGLTESPIHPGQSLENPLCTTCWSDIRDLHQGKTR